jgi:hypothetical protein
VEEAAADVEDVGTVVVQWPPEVEGRAEPAFLPLAARRDDCREGVVCGIEHGTDAREDLIPEGAVEPVRDELAGSPPSEVRLEQGGTSYRQDGEMDVRGVHVVANEVPDHAGQAPDLFSSFWRSARS